MKYREVEIFSGHRFQVPEHIQRLDSKKNRGWQLRYGKWLSFSDGTADGSGAGAALALAIEELHRRIDRLPAPTGLRQEPNASKNNDLPVGISGPVSRTRKGRRVAEYNFGVTIPRFGDKPTNANVYIGTRRTPSPTNGTRRLLPKPSISAKRQRGHIKALRPKPNVQPVDRRVIRRNHGSP